MQKTLVLLGLVFLVCGLLWPWMEKIPLGRLPGDILIDRPGFKISLPITTMVVVSLVLSLILKFFRK